MPRARYWSGLVAVALAAWALACLVTVLYEWIGGADAAREVLRDLFLTPTVLIPVVALSACVGVSVLLDRRVTLPEQGHWVAGGLFALASVVAVAVLGLAWGGEYVFLTSLVWSVCSGYLGFVWLGGAYVWRLRADRGLLLSQGDVRRQSPLLGLTHCGSQGDPTKE